MITNGKQNYYLTLSLEKVHIYFKQLFYINASRLVKMWPCEIGLRSSITCFWLAKEFQCLPNVQLLAKSAHCPLVAKGGHMFAEHTNF
jgi:hypothetical protein